MRAMLLAAGRGERMRPLTDQTPKPLLKVGGKSLIDWHLGKLAAAGFEEVVINHAWLGDQIESFVGDGSRWNLRAEHSRETEALETAGGIAKALPKLGDHPFLVVNADVWTDWDFGNALEAATMLCQRPEILAYLVLVPNPAHHPQGDFMLSPDGLALDPAAPGSADNTLTRYTFSGIGVYKADLFADIDAGQKAALAPLLRKAMHCGQVLGSIHQGQWHDVGTVQRLASLDSLLTR